MSKVIRNLNELSESREMLEAKTSPAISGFLVLIVMILSGGLIWSYYGEIDIVAKASSVVRPNEKINMLQPQFQGRIEYVHAVEGMRVAKGDLLVQLDHQELKSELENRRAEADRLENEIRLLHRYSSSIRDLNNLFSNKIAAETPYYDLVEDFLLDYNKTKLDYKGSKEQINTSNIDLLQARNSIDSELEISLRKKNEQIVDLNRQISLLTNEKTNEVKLKNSLISNINTIPADDTKRSEYFITYQIKLEQLIRQSEEDKNEYDRSLALGERLVAKAELEKLQKQYLSAEQAIQQYKAESLLQVENSIAQWSQKLAELNNSVAQLEKPESASDAEHESLEKQKIQLSEKQGLLKEQSNTLAETEQVMLKKLQTNRIVTIQGQIDEKKKSLDHVKEVIQQLTININKATFKAPISGVVNLAKELNTGTFVQPGETMLSIIPDQESKFKMSIAVPNHEIGKIEVGNRVKFNFHAFPKQSYGSLEGIISLVGTDSVVREDGRSYYIVEATIDNRLLRNRKGEQGEVKVGMTADAYVITDSKKIIHYLLEKINLKE